jgi:DNA processing protein
VNSAQQVLLHLSLLDSISPSAVSILLKRGIPSFSAWHELYAWSAHDWISIGISAASSQKIVAMLADREALERELTLLEKHVIGVTTLLDTSYPLYLKNIHLPPPVLYWKGRPIENANKCMAVVGSRDADAYAQRHIERLVPPLITNGWGIVSGGALGADTMAHQTALDYQGYTVAVLGSGLLCPYPRKNIGLFDSIIEAGGTLLTAFSLNTQPLPYNFPARNRVIAGLSRGCMVVQAAEQSGARITATFALEQGREVFAVPGSLDHPLSAGSHALIKEGATLITRAEDILEHFGETSVSVPAVKTQPAERIAPIPFEKVNKESVPYEAHTAEARIVKVCTTPSTTDEIAHHLNIDLSMVQQKLFDLQLEGFIEQTLAGQWITHGRYRV